MTAAGDPYTTSTYLTNAQLLAGQIDSPVVPDTGLGVEVLSVALTPDTTLSSFASLLAGTNEGFARLLTFSGDSTNQLTAWNVRKVLVAGDWVRAQFNQPIAGGVQLDVVGVWTPLLAPPPPLGVWCEPFVPASAGDADTLYTDHLERMNELSLAF